MEIKLSSRVIAIQKTSYNIYKTDKEAYEGVRAAGAEARFTPYSSLRELYQLEPIIVNLQSVIAVLVNCRYIITPPSYISLHRLQPNDHI